MNDLAAGFHDRRDLAPSQDSVARVSCSMQAIESEGDIIAWVQGPLRELIPHQCAIFAYGFSHSLGITLERKFCVDLSATYFDAISLPNGQLRSPVLEKWLRLSDSMEVDINAPEWSRAQNWRANFVRFGLRNGIADGYQDQASGLFVFGFLLNLNGPHWVNLRLLHDVAIEQVFRAWQRVIAREVAKQGLLACKAVVTLTRAESEVVRWVRVGKTNEEIGIILGKSGHTVKTQVQAILEKTSLRNRILLATSVY